MSQNSEFEEELEALQAIYMEDLIVDASESCETVLKITLHPSTGDNEDEKFVCLTLTCHVSTEYPDKEPIMSIKNPRGISEAHVTSIEENLAALSRQKIGEAMLFDLLQYAQDSLSDNNRPSCVCPVCLENFRDEEKFFRTECYHFYHFTCIKGYICITQAPYVCPVCRFEISDDDVDKILDFTLDNLSIADEEPEKNDFAFTDEYKEWLTNSRLIYEKQKRNGGIIDLEYEKKKYLITEETNFTVTRTSPEPSETTEITFKESDSSFKGKFQHKQNRMKYENKLGDSSTSQGGKCNCPKLDDVKQESHRKAPRKYVERPGSSDSKRRTYKETKDYHDKPHKKKTASHKPQRENQGYGNDKPRQEKRDRASKEKKLEKPVGEKKEKKKFERNTKAHRDDGPSAEKIEKVKQDSVKLEEKPIKLESTSQLKGSPSPARNKKSIGPPPGFKPLLS